jgi:hypothetical protein
MGHFPKRDRSMASPISSPQPPPGHVFSRAHEHQKADGRSSRATDRIEVTSFSSNRRPHHAPDPFFSSDSDGAPCSRRSGPHRGLKWRALGAAIRSVYRVGAVSLVRLGWRALGLGHRQISTGAFALTRRRACSCGPWTLRRPGKR